MATIQQLNTLNDRIKALVSHGTRAQSNNFDLNSPRVQITINLFQSEKFALKSLYLELTDQDKLALDNLIEDLELIDPETAETFTNIGDFLASFELPVAEEPAE